MRMSQRALDVIPSVAFLFPLLYLLARFDQKLCLNNEEREYVDELHQLRIASSEL